MGMWTTENQDKFAEVLKGFSDAAYKNYSGHSFEAGYLQSLAVQMLAEMPKRMQKVFIEDMIRATKRQDDQYAESQTENKIFERI